MKDFLGNELHVGDKVIYCNTCTNSAKMRRGRIVHILEENRPVVYWTRAVVLGEDTHRTSQVFEGKHGEPTNIIKYDW